MSEQERRQFLVKGLALGTAVVVADVGLPRCARLAEAAAATEGEAGATKERPLEELAYCGADCQQCELYKATRENDLEVKARFANNWKKAFGVTIAAEDVACDGCRSDTGRLGYHCSSVCDVRKCGLSRKVTSCAVCEDFPSCDKKLWENWPAMHALTEKRHKRLG